MASVLTICDRAAGCFTARAQSTFVIVLTHENAESHKRTVSVRLPLLLGVQEIGFVFV